MSWTRFSDGSVAREERVVEAGLSWWVFCTWAEEILGLGGVTTRVGDCVDRLGSREGIVGPDMGEKGERGADEFGEEELGDKFGLCDALCIRK